MQQNWMSRFSDNIRDYDGYAIGKLFKLLNDPATISLAGGLPSPDTFLKDDLQRISQRRLQEDADTIMQYTDISGEMDLIEAVIQFLKEDNINISKENIVITSSGQQGLDLTGRLFLNPADAVILDRPTFAGAIVAFQMQRPIFAGVEIEADGSDIEGFDKKIAELIRQNIPVKYIYVVPDFQNPTGISMSLEKREALLDLSYEYDIPIVEDSPYRSLRYHGDNLPAIFELDQNRKGDHVIGVYTFSKLFCPGMRVGFNIGPKAVIGKMANIKQGNTLNSPKYNQDMCAAFLQEMDWKTHLENCRSYYREKLAIFLNTMQDYFPEEMGVSWTKPQGGLFLWATVPEGIDTLELFYEAIKFKVAFVPGEVFYGENPAKNHMRINFSYPSKDQLTEAIKRLADCIKKYQI
ncbi:Transcriptional regulator, GntR family domain / Aspartate aminotransferase (EC [Olavius sp. associated proteobacterium Delta 1]|nr:Transcriptional regulator, GntR family domain / Aspartate aminotransferase (EC [Olavius sp. associated proteobacterium Delta 1]